MPAEPRRTSRKQASEEDVELKRARGEISCAECRRYEFSLPRVPRSSFILVLQVEAKVRQEVTLRLLCTKGLHNYMSQWQAHAHT